MAYFQDKSELSRQKRYVGMDKAKGLKKMGLSVMGYKDDGSRNSWGKAGGIGLITGTIGATFGGKAGFMVGKQIGDISSRVAATQFAKGSDVSEVMRETQDEYASKKLAESKFMYDAYSPLSGAMSGGGGGVDLAGMVSPETSEKLNSMIKDESINAAKSSIESEADEMIGDKSKSKLLKSVLDDNEDDDNEDEDEELTSKEKRNKREQMLLKGLKKVSGGLPLIDSGSKLRMAAKAENQEANKMISALGRKTANFNEFNLL